MRLGQLLQAGFFIPGGFNFVNIQGNQFTFLLLKYSTASFIAISTG